MRVISSLVLASLGSLVACSRGPSAPIGTIDVSLEDGRISAAVRTALLNERDLGVREIAVESRRGVVTLSGTVRSADEAQRAETLAREVKGVREVKSALRVEPNVMIGSHHALYLSLLSCNTRRSTHKANPTPSHSLPRGLPSASLPSGMMPT